MSNSKPVPEGTVIMAESQYAGRGQQQNKWHSEPGKNLTFSLLLNPVFLAIGKQFDLTRVVSLGVQAALQPLLGNELKIKWPNDVYYGDKKLGGILIENILQGSVIKHAVVGIGLNINQLEFADWVPNPASVAQILHKDCDLKLLLSDICKNIEVWYLKLKAGKTAEIRAAYLKHLYWLNQPRRFRSKGDAFDGVITNVKEQGLLVVENQGREHDFSFKEIEFLNR